MHRAGHPESAGCPECHLPRAQVGLGPVRSPDERGFSIMEVIVASLIAVVAILGLAHSFGVGRGLIDRYAMAREARAIAQRRIETLSTLPLTDAALSPGQHGPGTVTLYSDIEGVENWWVDPVDDPVDGLDPDDDNPIDYMRVRVSVSWAQGSFPDTVTLWRMDLSP